jgi:hypothetical protein
MTGCEKDGLLCYAQMRFSEDCQTYKIEVTTDSCKEEIEADNCQYSRNMAQITTFTGFSNDLGQVTGFQLEDYNEEYMFGYQGSRQTETQAVDGLVIGMVYTQDMTLFGLQVDNTTAIKAELER